ncbi:hypothetical protein LCGC14_1148520 [marine sediment metagenome]|uniref:Uncharacterized protein n=1 Tax=marine sediment metagenome TaxID=412755 RepID=A0A0F9LW86_9ZZZZ
MCSVNARGPNSLARNTGPLSRLVQSPPASRIPRGQHAGRSLPRPPRRQRSAAHRTEATLAATGALCGTRGTRRWRSGPEGRDRGQLPRRPEVPARHPTQARCPRCSAQPAQPVVPCAQHGSRAIVAFDCQLLLPSGDISTARIAQIYHQTEQNLPSDRTHKVPGPAHRIDASK